MNTAQAIIDRASQNSTGDQASVARAMGAYLTRAKIPMVNYASAAEPIKALARFDMSSVTRQDQLQTQVQAVKKFIAANDALLAFIKNSDNVLIAEFESAHLPQVGIDEAMKGYHRAVAEQNELSVKVRLQDKVVGDAMLGALNLLDVNWGKWKYSVENRTVQFDDHVVWKKYIAFLDDMDAAVHEQTRLQRQLVTLAKK